MITGKYITLLRFNLLNHAIQILTKCWLGVCNWMCNAGSSCMCTLPVRWHYNVTPSFIGWSHAWDDFWLHVQLYDSPPTDLNCTCLWQTLDMIFSCISIWFALTWMNIKTYWINFTARSLLISFYLKHRPFITLKWEKHIKYVVFWVMWVEPLNQSVTSSLYLGIHWAWLNICDQCLWKWVIEKKNSKGNFPICDFKVGYISCKSHCNTLCDITL